MIDLHSHILPGLDDGAQTLEDALAMARGAVAEGIRIVAATPHHNNRKYTNPAGELLSYIQYFNEQLIQNDIPLTVVGGQEIRVNRTFLGELYAGHALTLNGSRYLLIELPTASIPSDVDEVIHELLVAGYVPIIAHPERNAAIAEDPDRLERLIELGALSQITTHSLCGLFGSKLQKLSLQLCQRNLAHIVASDAHDINRRAFLMGEAYHLLRRKLGESTADYFRDNAQAVLDNRIIESQGPLHKTKKKFIWW
jgi:protein-tyrosine phosphatase